MPEAAVVASASAQPKKAGLLVSYRTLAWEGQVWRVGWEGVGLIGREAGDDGFLSTSSVP